MASNETVLNNQINNSTSINVVFSETTDLSYGDVVCEYYEISNDEIT